MRARNRFELAYNGLIKAKPLLLLATALCFFATAHGQKSTALVLTQTIAFLNLQGGFNHTSVDSEHHRLFAAAPSNKTLEIVDLKAGKTLQSLPGKRPAAARFSLEFNQLYVSCPQGVPIYDGSTLDIITTVNVDSAVDELQYDPGAHELYAGCMTEGQTGIAVIAVPEGKLVGKISLPAKPQGFAVELKGQRIFANVPIMKQVAVMDRERRAEGTPLCYRRVRGEVTSDARKGIRKKCLSKFTIRNARLRANLECATLARKGNSNRQGNLYLQVRKGMVNRAC
jgi:hypothetical protein